VIDAEGGINAAPDDFITLRRSLQSPKAIREAAKWWRAMRSC